jgi:hypothetical protein
MHAFVDISNTVPGIKSNVPKPGHKARNGRLVAPGIAGMRQKNKKVNVRKRCKLTTTIPTDSDKSNFFKARLCPKPLNAGIDGLA